METPLTVYGAWEAFGVPDFSPACLKLKTYLRMTNTPYVAAPGDPRKAPTKKIPYVAFEGALIGDSGLIIEHLKKKLGDPLDSGLTAEQRAQGHVVRRTVEESLYWAVIHARWMDERVWPEYAPQFMKVMPPVVGGLVLRLVRKNVVRDAWGHGLGRHTEENIVAHGRADLDALSTVLGDKPYLFGDAPTSYDASMYGSLANTLAFPANSAVATHARSKKNLVAFVDRVKEKYWSTPEAKA